MILTPLKGYLHDISGVNVHTYDIDPGANDYPCWTITLEDDINLQFLTVKSMDALINVKCNLYTDRKNTEQALEIITKTLKKINQFDEANNSGIGSSQTTGDTNATITTELSSNTIKLSFPFRLKSIISGE